MLCIDLPVPIGSGLRFLILLRMKNFIKILQNGCYSFLYDIIFQ